MLGKAKADPMRWDSFPEGRLRGNIATPVLVIVEGGIFDGMCKMAKREGVAPNKVPISEIEPSPK